MGARRSTGWVFARWFLFPTQTWEPLLLTRVVQVRVTANGRMEKYNIKVHLAALMDTRHVEKNKGNRENVQTRQGSVLPSIWKQKRNTLIP